MADETTTLTTGELGTATGVQATVHHPASSPIAACVYAHGAGGNRDAVLLQQLGTAFAARGVAFARIDLPYRQRRPKGPPSSSQATDQGGILAAVTAVQGLFPHLPVLVGGHSYGGRMTSLVVSDGRLTPAGLLLTSYPLHPPGKPERLRTEHLSAIGVPTLVVHGPRDPFGTTAELQAALALIAAPTHLVEVEGTGHDLAPARKPTAELTVTAATDFFGLA